MLSLNFIFWAGHTNEVFKKMETLDQPTKCTKKMFFFYYILSRIFFFFRYVDISYFPLFLSLTCVWKYIFSAVTIQERKTIRSFLSLTFFLQLSQYIVTCYCKFFSSFNCMKLSADKDLCLDILLYFWHYYIYLEKETRRSHKTNQTRAVQ